MALPVLPLIGLGVLIALSIYKWIIEPVFYHPLRHIPSAHWSIPVFGNLWILWQRYRSRNNAVTYAAHLKHGTVVRMGREELSVNCVDNGIRTIYAGGWEKHTWYSDRFGSYGVLNMFTTARHTPHSQKKRTLANVYSKSYIAASPQVKANSTVLFRDRLLPLIHNFAQSGTPIDIYELNNAFAMDFMTAFQFGLSASTNLTQDIAFRKEAMYHYHCRHEFDFFSSELPWIKRISRKLGFPLVPDYVDVANKWLEDWNVRMCQNAEKQFTCLSRPGAFPGDDPVVYKQFKTAMLSARSKDATYGQADGEPIPLTSEGKPSDITRAEIYSDMLDQLTAGHETSGLALTYLMWEMSRNPLLQKQLREEVRTLEPAMTWPPPAGKPAESFAVPEPRAVDALPILHAIVMETLRLHSPIPGIEPRTSPYVPGGSQLGSYSGIPGGVRVSAMPYTLHRNTAVFPDPESFKPERWLTKDVEQLKEMHRWFWAFGSGGRMCIGSHLATHEIKAMVAALYTNWETEIFNDEGIEEVDAYTTRPRSGKLILKFVPVEG